MSVARTADQTGNPEASQASRRVEWWLRLTSLWTPVLLFGAGFVPYVTWVQMRPQDASWLQPALKALAALMAMAILGLTAFRIAVPSFRKLRRLRVDAAELKGTLRR